MGAFGESGTQGIEGMRREQELPVAGEDSSYLGERDQAVVVANRVDPVVAEQDKPEAAVLEGRQVPSVAEDELDVLVLLDELAARAIISLE